MSSWHPINTLELTDDLVWLKRGDSIEGPRTAEPDDYDEFDEWAYCTPPID